MRKTNWTTTISSVATDSPAKIDHPVHRDTASSGRPVMKVTIQSKSGESSFECEVGENLLYAGLRNGLSLPYECATGTCGTCRARVMAGQPEIGWSEAPGLSYVKQEKREVLMCQATARGDCTLRVPAKVADGGGRGVAPEYSSGTIARVGKLTHDVMYFAVDLDAPMRFDAGQFVVVEAGAMPGGRAYSMINYADGAAVLEFVVKRKPDGRFSDWLFGDDCTGRTLRIFGPLGRATFHPEEGKNVLCIGGGSGIAGIMSILAKAAGEGYFSDRKGYVFFGVRTAEDTFFMDELSAHVAAAPDNLDVTVALSDEDVSPALERKYAALSFATGFVHTVAAERMAGRWDDVIAYVAGPPPMVDGALRMLIIEARLPGTDIRYDKFG
ncbi:MAG: 2Fe-2S iron-sulfur cluster-binding protein [Rhodospirillales bacterium]